MESRPPPDALPNRQLPKPFDTRPVERYNSPDSSGASTPPSESSSPDLTLGHSAGDCVNGEMSATDDGSNRRKVPIEPYKGQIAKANIPQEKKRKRCLAEMIEDLPALMDEDRNLMAALDIHNLRAKNPKIPAKPTDEDIDEARTKAEVAVYKDYIDRAGSVSFLQSNSDNKENRKEVFLRAVKAARSLSRKDMLVDESVTRDLQVQVSDDVLGCIEKEAVKLTFEEKTEAKKKLHSSISHAKTEKRRREEHKAALNLGKTLLPAFVREKDDNCKDEKAVLLNHYAIWTILLLRLVHMLYSQKQQLQARNGRLEEQICGLQLGNNDATRGPSSPSTPTCHSSGFLTGARLNISNFPPPSIVDCPPSGLISRFGDPAKSLKRHHVE